MQNESTHPDRGSSRFRLVISDWSRLWLLLLAALLPVAVVVAVVRAFSSGEWENLASSIGFLYLVGAVLLLLLIALLGGYVWLYLWMRAAFTPEKWGVLVSLGKGLVIVAFFGACVVTAWQGWSSITWLERDWQRERQSGEAKSGTRLIYVESMNGTPDKGLRGIDGQPCAALRWHTDATPQSIYKTNKTGNTHGPVHDSCV